MATHPSVSPPIDVSAIVIARNEEENIADVLQALLDALSHARDAGALASYEIILADSASTDRTVELASRYPVRIVRLRSHWPLSAAAGRATGARFASGKHLLFVDGDYLLDEHWLPHAMHGIERPRVGEVGGVDLEEISGVTVLARRWAKAQAELPKEDQEVDTVAVGLVRREAYDAVGGFHPYLRGGEDRDFCFRLRAAGWRILRTKEVMGIHRWSRSHGAPMTYVEYYRSVAVWSLGDGQACRARWRVRDLRRQFLRRYATARFVIHDLQLVLGIALLLLNLAALAGLRFALVAIVVDIIVLAGLRTWGARRHLSGRETLYELQGLLYGPLRQFLFAIGLLRRLPPADAYPKDAEVLPSEFPHEPPHAT